MQLDLLTALISTSADPCSNDQDSRGPDAERRSEELLDYTNTPVDNERVAAAFREHGFEAGLDRLVASA